MTRQRGNRLQHALQFAAWIALTALAGCEREKSTTAPVPKGGVPMTLRIESPAFKANQPIPKRYTGDGDDVSPPLTFSDLPENTRELALIVDDPDAPTPQPWVHWVIYKIPAGVTSLPEGVKTDAKPAVPAGSLQGENSWGTIGYRGPAPPKGHGVHHYHFKLYALDRELSVKAGLDKEGLLKAMQGHILAEGELVGTYQR